MNIKYIEDRFKNINAKVDGRLFKTAVMILITEENGESKIILEKRALNLKRQPGDICFPGGKVDRDENPRECAIRECCEELNIKKDDITVIGQMDPIITPYGMIMYIFIGKIDKLPSNPSKAEVDRLYQLSIKELMKKEPLIVEEVVTSIKPENFPYHLIMKGKDYKFSKINVSKYFYEYDEFTVWGYTASILNEFIQLLNS